MRTFEYKRIEEGAVSQAVLNREGRAGWELVHIESYIRAEPVPGVEPIRDRYPYKRMWFKRARARPCR